MARRKIHHAKSTETNDETGAVKTLKQQQHSKTSKQETKTTAKSKIKEPNSQQDVGIPVERNTIINAFTDDSPTFCASEEKEVMQPTSEGLSNTTTKNSSDISSALSIDQYEHIEDHSQSASTCSNLDQEGAGAESLMTNSDSHIPITPKKSRRKVTRRKTPSICSPASYSASTTPSPAPSPSLAQQSPNQMTNIIGVPSSNGQFICPSCNEAVDSQSEYTRHIRQHNLAETSANAHSCSLCGKVLSSASSLDRHMLVHSGERPFKCRICGMAFTTNGNMHRHMRTHHDGAAASGDRSSPMQASEDENTTNRKSRTYVKRKRLQSPLKPSARKSGQAPELLPSKGKQLHESENCDENSVGGKTHDDEWDEFYDKSVSDTSKSVSSLSLASPQKRKCTENNNILLEKSDDASNNNWLNGSLNGDLDDSLRCLVCAKTFLSKMGLHNHLDGHLPNELQCKECKDSKAFPSYQALLKHCRLSHSPTGGEFRSDNEAIPSDADIPLPHSATVGFHDLTFIDFSSGKFALIAKSACERSVRWPSSNYHIFQCRHCKKAFPSSGSLKMHEKSTHTAFTNVESPAISNLKNSIPKCNRDEKTTIMAVTESTCNQCHAAFASHHQLEMHCLRHQAAEQCTTPYSTVEKNNSEDMDPAAADLAPQLNKENFLALFELQSKTKDNDVMPALTSLNPKQQFFQNGNNNVELEDDDSSTKLQRSNLNAQWNNLLTNVENGDHCAGTPFGGGNSNTGDFADIQSMIAVTSTASAIPSMMMMGSSPFTSRVASPPPPKSLASPRLADSVTASPELPLEHNNALASSSSANRQSPTKSTSSLSSTPSSLSASPAKSLENEQELYLLDMENDDAADEKNLKEFACNQCPRVLPSLRALKAHNRIHLGGSPYHCNVCPFISAEKSTLIRHLRTHNGERPYMCTICQYAFTTKANCERHLRTKHGRNDKEEVRSAMRYMAFDIREGGVDGTASFASSNACPHCNLQFAQAKLLKQHLHVQHNDMYSPKPFTCLKCKLRFLSHKTCLRHISKQHLDVAQPEEAIGTTLTSLSSFSQANSPSENCLKSHHGMVESQDTSAESEPTRSQSADGTLVHVHTPITASSVSTLGSVLALPPSILDLSSVSKDPSGRPASYPGALIPAVPYAVSQAELLDRPLDPNESEDNDQSSLESLINLTTSRMNAYDIPPQEQPLDLALYPMDLSYNASSFEDTFSPSSALSPMDLSASHRQTSSICTPNISTVNTPQLSILPSAHNVHSFSHNSPSPFQSRAPSSFVSAQKLSPPSRASPYPIPAPPLQHVANRYSQRPIQHLDVDAYRAAYGSSGSRSAPHFSTPSGPISQPLTVSTNLSSTTLSTMPSLSPPEPHMMPPEAYSSPKVAERGGRKRSGSSNGHGRGHLLPTSANSFLLKKQKQRRYRTERPFRCAHCAAGFTLRSNMERHIKQQHPEFWASKARGRKLVPTSTLSMVTPSISISPIHSSAVSHNIPEMPQLLSSTPAFPELLHMMQADVEPPHITFHRTEQQPSQKIAQVPSLSLLKNDQTKATISSEVKQAISKQIKQRKGHLELSAMVLPASLAAMPSSAPLSAITTSIPAFPDNNPSLMEDESSSSESSLAIVLPPVIKVAETVFPPADERPEGIAMNSPRPPASPLQLAIPVAKVIDDAEDTLPDLASVSKLLDTASQQNIQEMFRCSETVDDDENVNRVESKDKEGLVDPFKMTHTQTKDDRYLFHDGNSNKFTPVPAEEALASASGESPAKSVEKSRDGKRSAYNSAPNRVACPYCHRLFPWTSSLRRHILTHTGQKPHKCPICPLWFTTKSNCDRHLARKHNNPQQAKSGKPAMLAIFPAPGTSLVASPMPSTSSSLPDCTARNAPDRPYRCHFCLSSTFSTPKNLKKHLDSKHPGSQPQISIPQQSSELLQGLEKTETSHDISAIDQDDGAFASRIKMEAQSDGNSNSGSDQCWGESEESGEDTAPEGSPAPPSSSRPGAPLFFCFVCLKSFAERERCLQHVRYEHPADHAQLALNTVSDNANESDDATHEKQYIPETTSAVPVNEPNKRLASASNGDVNIPEAILHSNKIGTESDDMKKTPEDVLDRPEFKREAAS